MGDSAITRDTAGRFVLLGTLYFAQGLPYGFFSLALPVFLRQGGVSLSKIGFTSLLVLPWALKFLWAPFLDRVYWPKLGRRRTWILAMQLAATILLALAYAHSPFLQRFRFVLTWLAQGIGIVNEFIDWVFAPLRGLLRAFAGIFKSSSEAEPTQ